MSHPTWAGRGCAQLGKETTSALSCHLCWPFRVRGDSLPSVFFTSRSLTLKRVLSRMLAAAVGQYEGRQIRQRHLEDSVPPPAPPPPLILSLFFSFFFSLLW